jgi:hypothetical protein
VNHLFLVVNVEKNQICGMIDAAAGRDIAPGASDLSMKKKKSLRNHKYFKQPPRQPVSIIVFLTMTS